MTDLLITFGLLAHVALILNFGAVVLCLKNSVNYLLKAILKITFNLLKLAFRKVSDKVTSKYVIEPMWKAPPLNIQQSGSFKIDKRAPVTVEYLD